MSSVSPAMSPNQVGTALSPNQVNNTFTGGAGLHGGGVSTSEILATVLAKLAKDNQNVRQQMQQVQNGNGNGGAQQGNGADNSQGNTEMLKLQQAVTEMNTDTSLGTNMVQGVGDTHKDIAKATH